MPAVTPTEPKSLPTVADASGTPRPVEQVGNAVHSFEGAGFPVRRPFPGAIDQTRTDPFLMMDQMGPVVYAPGKALGAPDHPHRGFETVTYLLDGEMEHRDSYGGGGVIRGGDTQWMTAGSGLVHSEMPTEKMMREGGLLHGVQIWVNLPKSDKRAEPRYQDITGDQLTLFRNDDGTAIVRLIAGDLAGQHGPGNTHTPIVLAHATLDPGAHLALDWPEKFNALVYVLSGAGRVGGTGRTLAVERTGRGARRGRHARARRARRPDGAARSAAARRSADPRADVLLRPVRDEHEVGDHRGDRRLPGREDGKHPAARRLSGPSPLMAEPGARPHFFDFDGRKWADESPGLRQLRHRAAPPRCRARTEPGPCAAVLADGPGRTPPIYGRRHD